jgi:hypothetical protein
MLAGVMRRAKRPPVGERTADNLTGHGGDHGNFEEFRRRQRRQARGQHRLAGAGRRLPSTCYLLNT